MKEMLWQVCEMLAIWFVISVFAGAVAWRVFVRLKGTSGHEVHCGHCAELADVKRDDIDIVDATGEVDEPASGAPQGFTTGGKNESSDAIARLWSTVHNTAAFEKAWVENERERERSENRKEAR